MVRAALISGMLALSAVTANAEDGDAYALELTPDAAALGAFTLRDTVRPHRNQFVTEDNDPAIVWSHNSRWGLTVDLDERARGFESFDGAEAGGFFHVTPRLRFQGAVRFGEETPGDPLTPEELREGPQVRLESAFRF